MAIELATAYISLIPTTRGIANAIRSDLAGAEVQKASAAAGEQASGSFFGSWKKIGAGIAAVGVADALKNAIQGASKFQSETELLVTAGGEAQSALGSVRSGLESIATATGTSLSQLSDGMYTLEKAGLRGASGLSVLRVAAEGARAENVDLGTMTNALTSIMRSYNLPASQATQVTNELVAASGAAKTTMQEFAGSLSTVLPIASASGLSFAQVGGAIATLTSHGTSAAEATQELANTIRNLQAPNHVAIQEMAQFGINANTVSTQLGKRGLTGTLAELTSAITSRMGPAGTVLLNAFNQSQGAAADMQIEISKMPPSLQTLAKSFADGKLSLADWRKEVKALPADQAVMAQGFLSTYNQAHKFNDLLTSGSPAAQTYAAALSKMVGGATGLNTALMLTGGSSATFAKNVATIGEASKQGGKDISTWAKTQQNFSVQMSRLGEVAQTTSVKLGSALLPKLTAVGGWIANNTGTVKIAGTAFLALASAMLVGSVAAKGIAAAEGVYSVLTGEATAKTGLQIIALGAQKVALAATTAAQWALNTAMDANPIGLIVAALAALVAGLVLAYQHSATFRAAVEDVWKAVQVAAKAIGNAFVDAWHVVVGAFDAVTSFLKQWGPLILAVIAPVIGIPLLIWQHWSVLTSYGSQAMHGFASGLTTGFNAVISWIAGLPGRIGGMFTGCVNWLVGAGQQLVNGFIHGIESMAGALIHAIESTITDNLPWFVKKALGIHSPSRVFMEIGSNIMAGLVAGITDGTSDPAHAMSASIDRLQATARAAQATVGATGTVPALAGSSAAGAPMVGQINVTAYNPAEAAQATAAEIGWLSKTSGY